MTSKYFEKNTDRSIEWCIVATRRQDGKRVMIDAPLSREEVYRFEPNRFLERNYKFFRVAKFPYKSK